MDICKYELCSGCGVCSAVCPHGAIAMKADEEGFLRPEIYEDHCINCGLCTKECPVNTILKKAPEEVYAAYSKNAEVRKSSSSGGIFYSIARAVIENGGVVCGAGFSCELRVVHKFADDEETLRTLMGSKYVQSDIGEVYGKIREYKKAKRTVLFVGTPCQCAAVRNYVGDCEEVICVDFICHGVPTPLLWKKYVSEEFPDATWASFRDKKRGWEEFSMRIDKSGGSYSCSQYKDPYLRMFLKNYALRPSCYKCSRKGDNYSSDITLADFWEISKYYPEMNDDKGVSVVIIRSEKGRGLFESVKGNLVCKKSDMDTVKRVNPAYVKSSGMAPERALFFRKIKDNESFRSISKVFGKQMPARQIFYLKSKTIAKKLICKVYKLKKQ